MSQGLLFDAPPAKATAPKPPAPPAVDPIAVEGKRLSRQCQAILERLQAGRASNDELSRIARKYTGRISDLRAAGHKVKLVERNHETGLTWYELEK